MKKPTLKNSQTPVDPAECKSQISIFEEQQKECQEKIDKLKMDLLKIYTPQTNGDAVIGEDLTIVKVVGFCIDPPELIVEGNSGGRTSIDPTNFKRIGE